MAEGKRPGGLTALAVLNFIFGGLGALGILALMALLKVADTISTENGGTGVTASGAPGASVVYILLAFSAVQVALLITSGVGYIQLKKFLGRTLGSVYAVLSLISTGLSLAMTNQGFSIGTIIGLIYPVLTLVLLNVTFKDDFVN